MRFRLRVSILSIEWKRKIDEILLHCLLMLVAGDVSKAVELIQSALELDEKCEFAYETLGTIEVQRGNLKRAIELFDKELRMNIEN